MYMYLNSTRGVLKLAEDLVSALCYRSHCKLMMKNINCCIAVPLASVFVSLSNDFVSRIDTPYSFFSIIKINQTGLYDKSK